MITVEITKLTDYGKFRSKLRVARLQLATVQKQILRETVEKFLLPKIRTKMAQANYGRDIIASTIVSDVFIFEETFQVIIKSEVLSGDASFDIVRFREFGTKRHFIEPKDPDGVLSWIQDGERVYSKGHWVSGIVGLNLIKDTITEERENIQKEFQRREEQWFKSVIA